jgi:hypothetical protein
MYPSLPYEVTEVEDVLENAEKKANITAMKRPTNKRAPPTIKAITHPDIFFLGGTFA